MISLELVFNLQWLENILPKDMDKKVIRDKIEVIAYIFSEMETNIYSTYLCELKYLSANEVEKIYSTFQAIKNTQDVSKKLLNTMSNSELSESINSFQINHFTLFIQPTYNYIIESLIILNGKNYRTKLPFERIDGVKVTDDVKQQLIDHINKHQ